MSVIGEGHFCEKKFTFLRTLDETLGRGMASVSAPMSAEIRQMQSACNQIPEWDKIPTYPPSCS